MRRPAADTTAKSSESKCLTDGKLKALRIVAIGHGIASVRVQRYAEGEAQ
jgi:hypothetical protein